MNSKLKHSLLGALVAPALLLTGGALLSVGKLPATANAAGNGIKVGQGLVLPPMDPVRGKHLFASKGCVVCHAVNGVGGTDAPEIDAATMKPNMNPFDFVAKMWNHSQGMVAMQQSELGGQITFDNGQEIADIIAFLHDPSVQKTFTEADIPQDIKAHMEGDDEGSGEDTNKEENMMKGHGSMMKGSGGNMMKGN